MKQSTLSEKYYTQTDVIIIIAFGLFSLLITTGAHVIGVTPNFIRCALSVISATVAFVWTYLHFTEETLLRNAASIGVICTLIAVCMDTMYILGLVFMLIR